MILLIGLLVGPPAALVVAWRLGALADPYAMAWRRISGTYAVRRRQSSPLDNIRSLRWLADRFGLDGQLKRAGIQRRPEMFLASCIVYAVAVVAGALAVDIVVNTALQIWPIPLNLAVVIGSLMGAARLLRLPRAVRHRARLLDDCMTEILVPLTILTANNAVAGRRDAIRLLARCLDTPELSRFWEPPDAFGRTREEMSVDYRVLVADRGERSDGEIFSDIGERYGLATFTALGHAENDVDKSRRLYSAFAEVAVTFLQRQLADDEERADRAKAQVTAVTSLFILIVFGVILVPLGFIIVQSLQGAV